MISIQDVTAGLKRGPALFLEELVAYAIGCTSGKVFLCTATIAKNTYYSRRHVFNGLNDIEAAGQVERENRPDHRRGGLTTNLYHLKGKALAYVEQQIAQKRARATEKAAAAIAYVKRVARAARAGASAFAAERYAMAAQRSSEFDKKVKEGARDDGKWRANLPEIRASLGGADNDTPLSELYAARHRGK